MNTMEIAIKMMADHLAKKAAKARGTESAKYIEGYSDAVVFCAMNPPPNDVELIAVVASNVPPESASATGTGEGSP